MADISGADPAFVASPSSQEVVSTEGFNRGEWLPARYSELTPSERREARTEYAKLQKGLCYHCKAPLANDPPAKITSLSINWRRFPPNFLRYPHHLHHDHDTDLTIGVVHAYCNAVLWQYHGE